MGRASRCWGAMVPSVLRREGHSHPGDFLLGVGECQVPAVGGKGTGHLLASPAVPQSRRHVVTWAHTCSSSQDLHVLISDVRDTRTQ